jgi:predicted component of type VI protein secretion system
MQVILVMFRSDGKRRSFSIVRDITVLGRREDCDLRIPLGDISRKHARFIRSGDRLRLEDLGSSNGTFCNGERITSIELQPGDTVVVGPVTFVVQIDGVPVDEEIQPYADRSDGQAVGADTSIAAGAVAVGTMQEVGADADELELPTLEDVNLGEAPLIASADDEEEITSLEPVEEAAAAEPEAVEELGSVEELEEVTELEEESPAPPVKPTPVRKKPAAPAAEKDEPVVDGQAIEGELQASDQFEPLSEQSAFDILVDDNKSDDSSAADVHIDWNQESKA